MFFLFTLFCVLFVGWFCVCARACVVVACLSLYCCCNLCSNVGCRCLIYICVCVGDCLFVHVLCACVGVVVLCCLCGFPFMICCVVRVCVCVFVC